jgi:hypothetical protein
MAKITSRGKIRTARTEVLLYEGQTGQKLIATFRNWFLLRRLKCTLNRTPFSRANKKDWLGTMHAW